MSKMDFRYYDTDSKQWVSSLVDVDSFNNIATISQDVYNRYGKNAKLITDWNDIIESGLYMALGAVNAPDVHDWYIGEYVAHDEKWGVLEVSKIGAVQDMNEYKYTRTKRNLEWTSWRKVIDESDMRTNKIVSGPLGFNGDSPTLDTSLMRLAGTSYPRTSRADDMGIAFYRTDISALDTGVYELVFSGSPNSGGSWAYRAANFGYVTLSATFSDAYYYTIEYHEMFKQSAFAGMSFNLTVLFVSDDNTEVSSAVLNPTNWFVRVQVDGFMTHQGTTGDTAWLTLRRKAL